MTSKGNPLRDTENISTCGIASRMARGGGLQTLAVALTPRLFFNMFNMKDNKK
jgi:hypothetical protein